MLQGDIEPEEKGNAALPKGDPVQVL